MVCVFMNSSLSEPGGKAASSVMTAMVCVYICVRKVGIDVTKPSGKVTMNKNALCYSIPNMHTLVHQAPLCGGVNNYEKYIPS